MKTTKATLCQLLKTRVIEQQQIYHASVATHPASLDSLAKIN